MIQTSSESSARESPKSGRVLQEIQDRINLTAARLMISNKNHRKLEHLLLKLWREQDALSVKVKRGPGKGSSSTTNESVTAVDGLEKCPDCGRPLDETHRECAV